MVATPDGDRPIESIRAGDRVWTRGASGDREVGTVTRRWEHRAADHLVIPLADGGDLRVTAAHPVATPDGWVPAGKLEDGSMLVTAAGKSAVGTIRRESKSTRVFDLAVEPNQNYFASGVLVHNKTVMPGPEPSDLEGTWVGFSEGASRFVSLEINPDGSGAAIFTYPHIRDRRGYSVQSVRIVRYEITIVLLPEPQSAGGDDPYLRLIGKGYGGRGNETMQTWRAELSPQPYREAQVFHLFRPEALDKRMRELQEFAATAPAPNGSQELEAR